MENNSQGKRKRPVQRKSKRSASKNKNSTKDKSTTNKKIPQKRTSELKHNANLKKAKKNVSNKTSTNKNKKVTQKKTKKILLNELTLDKIESRKLEDQNKSKLVTPKFTNDTSEDDIYCADCQQKLDTKLKFHSGQPFNGFEENTILSSGLDVLSGDERECKKITCFSVYCKSGHLCPFDFEITRDDGNIFFSGFIKSICSDEPTMSNSTPGKNFGPIIEWWTTGFEIGEKPTVGFSTELADYILMEPSTEYEPYMQDAILKIVISKVIIEYLVFEPHATYEDLLYKLQSVSTYSNILSSHVREDDLLRYTPFICSQIMLFDELAKPWEPILITAPCIRRLINLVGIRFECNKSQIEKKKIQSRSKMNSFRKYLLDKLDKSKTLNLIKDRRIEKLLAESTKLMFSSKEEKEESRCGNCKQCLRPACDDCPACFSKNEEYCWQRRCFWREIQRTNYKEKTENIDIDPNTVDYSYRAYQKSVQTLIRFTRNITWPDAPIVIEDGNKYYDKVQIDNETIGIGDFVFTISTNKTIKPVVFKIWYMWENENGEKNFHGNYMWWGSDTVLGKSANSRELFSVRFCCNLPLFCIYKKVEVIERSVPAYWELSVTPEEYYKNVYFCEKSYDCIKGCFYDLSKKDETARLSSKVPHRFCAIQEAVELKEEKMIPRPSNVIKIDENDEKVYYEKVIYKNEEYYLGSCVYLKPKTLYFNYPMRNYPVKTYGSAVKKLDDEKYPEYYRKSTNSLADSKNDIPSPFDIGFIIEIFTKTNKLFIKVKKFYRPENTHKGDVLSKKCYVNMLFWSDEVITVGFNYVIGKCYVTHEKNLNVGIDCWSSWSPDRFYFTQMYKNKDFLDVDNKTYNGSIELKDFPKDLLEIKCLNTLNIFAGCGGFLLGLVRTGVIKTCWAIEPDKTAAAILKLNISNVSVFTTSCELILNHIKKGNNILDGQKLPTKGEVDLLCASLPCKNFNSMENFSVFTTSPISTFVEYCEYYKPKIFILDAAENLIKNNTVFKLTLTSLLAIGYQVAFNVMQIGNYGVPQNRKRVVLLGAAPGQKLPKYPKNVHVFPKSACQFYVVIDDKKYMPFGYWIMSAPFRAMTVYDVISDLPFLGLGYGKNPMNYNNEFLTHYQKMMRMNSREPTVFDHICKNLGPLVQTRISNIPTLPGSDWRNLPNIEVRLEDESFTQKINYNYCDSDAGNSSHGDLRGVCSCSSDGKCDLRNRQDNTLIPWHLVHSGKYHDHWPGLYGRLQWDGFFPGAISNPEPLGTEGAVLHPSQPRVVSVRECIRSHGFTDDFTLDFTMNIHDKYRQIGKATSPLFAIVLGQEIVRSVSSNMS